MEPAYNQTALEIDQLTRCFSRKSFFPFLEHQLLKAGLNKGSVSVAFIDLDGFKVMNDNRGHAFGDEALKYFSSSLRLSLEEDFSDAVMEAKRYVFRYGGDEFVVVFLDKTAHEAQKVIMASLHLMKKRCFLYKGREFQMTFSGGVATYPQDASGAVELIEKADKALYFIKKHGKGRVMQYSHMKAYNLKLFFAMIAGLALAGLVFFAASNLKQARKLFDLSKAAITGKIKPRSADLKRIYLKNKGVITGIIVKDSEPMEIRVVFDKGEGTIEVSRSEVLRIVSADSSVENIESAALPVYEEELTKVSMIRLKSGGEVEGVIIKDADPMQVKVLLDTGEAVVFIKKADVESIDGEKLK